MSESAVYGMGYFLEEHPDNRMTDINMAANAEILFIHFTPLKISSVQRLDEQLG